MEKYYKLVADHLAARKNKDKTASNVLGVLRGEVETTLKNGEADADGVVETRAKQMIKGLETVKTEEAKQEIEILKPYLPSTLTEAQIIEALDRADLAPSMNFGQKMGIAMKTVGDKADGSEVKRIVMKYYN